MNKLSYFRTRKFYLLVIGCLILGLVLGVAASSNLELAQAAPRAAAVGIGAGSYNTTLPAGAAGPNGTPKRTANVTGPMPTNDWWSSLGWQTSTNAYSNNMIPNPLGMRAKANGLGIGYTPTAGGGSYGYSEALTLGTVGLNSPDTKVDDYSDWTVTGYWSGGGSTLRATFGHGLPFVYATKTGGNALITFTGTPTIWSNSGNAVGATIGSRHFGIFAPAGATWTASGTTVQSTLAGKSYFSVAVLPDNSVATLNDFKAHAFAFITDTTVSWSYNQSAAQLTTTFTATTTPQEGTETRPLMALFRHHWLYSSDVNTTYTYNSSRGQMKVTRGSSFRTVMAFNGALPSLPDMGTYNRTTLNTYVNEVANSQGTITSDTYWAGKALNRASLLVWIADQMGNTAARDKLLGVLKTSLQNWLTAPDGNTAQMFHYNSTWGTLIGYPAAYGSNTDLNDHHFHYGYFVLAAATVANFDPAWASDSQWGGMVKLLIRDYNSWQRNDSMFPFLRNFDPYEGHGWASGNAFFGGGNNQESSSEAMMSNTGILLWGAATGDTAIRDLGVFLFANENAAIEQYWMDIDNVVFPSTYPQVAAGMIWSDGVAHGTWFSGAPEMIHGINFLPIIGSSYYLGRRPSYITTNYNEIVAENGGVEDEWVDIIWEYQALSDPAAAISKFGSGSYGPEAGESKAHTYHWIHNLNGMGRLDTTVTANIPTYAVFNKNGTRTYVAWNPGGSPITVSFSNGVNCNVAARQLFASTTCSGTPPPTTPPPTTPPPTTPPPTTPPPTTPPPTTPPPTTPPPTTPPPGSNLALGKPITCSNAEAGNPATNLVDGNTTTRWAGYPWPQTCQLDLGATYSMNRTELMPYSNRAYQYRIEVSNDGTTYTRIVDRSANTTGGATLTDSFAVASGRYVRLVVTGASGYTGGWSSFYEFRIFGGGTPPPTTPPPTTPPPTTPPPTTPPPTTPPPTTPPPTTPPPGTNLALGRPVTCSSVENAGTVCANAVDGNTGTRWSSAFSDPQWIYVDLGATRTLNRVVLRWEAAFGRAYRIEVSDNATSWTQVYSTTTGDGGIDDLTLSGSGRYVRVYGTVRALQYGYSLWELEVYGY
jgi:endoglucanase Acf2